MATQHGRPHGTRASLLPISAAVLLAASTQVPALGAFFSSPDDLVHLQQAAGLRPALLSPFRYLSQVVYFRVMMTLFGPLPIAFHLLSLVTHLLNVALVFLLLVRLAVPRSVAAVAAACFGCFPLFYPLLASAVGMNDELAVAFMLISLLLFLREGWASAMGSWAAFVAALLCKESVITMPLLLLYIARPRARPWRIVLMMATAALFAALLLLLPPQGLGPYAIGVGMNAFHNLMTYTAWAVNVTRPLPDLVSSYDPLAWRTGIWVAVAITAAWLGMAKARWFIGLGVAWWLIALLPVLLLQFQTYRHYLYPALPGLCLVCAAVARDGLCSAVTALRRSRPQGDRSNARWVAAVMALAVVLYAVQSHRLILRRQNARVPGTRLALDPFTRRQEVARNALASFARDLGSAGPTNVAIFSPPGTGRIYGARSGREYARPGPGPGQRPYDLLAESLDHGGAVRLFFPEVDTVRFVDRWTSELKQYELFLPYQEGFLHGVGIGVSAHARAAAWMFDQGWYAEARDYLADVNDAYPREPALLLAHGIALLRSGDSARASATLAEVIRLDPQGEAATEARRLFAMDSLGTPRRQ